MAHELENYRQTIQAGPYPKRTAAGPISGRPYDDIGGPEKMFLGADKFLIPSAPAPNSAANELKLASVVPSATTSQIKPGDIPHSQALMHYAP